MKNTKNIFLLFILILFFGFACGSGGSSDDENDNSQTVLSGTWYAFSQNVFGLAKVRQTLKITTNSFEQIDEYWDNTTWKQYTGFKGKLTHISGSEFTAELKEIYLPGGSTFSEMAWFDESLSEFSSYCFYLWSKTGDTTKISLEKSGSTLTYKRDQSGDGLFSSPDDSSVSMNVSDSTTLEGHGKYPSNRWRSWSFHGNTNKASSSIQLDSIFGESLDNSASTLVQSITGKAKDQNGNTYGPFTYDWDSVDEDWGMEYTFTDPSPGGIWWLAEITITYKDGSNAVYTAADPWSNYTVSYTTDTGYVSPSAVSCDFIAAQDYMAPDAAGSGCTFYYVRTLPNASGDLAADKSDFADTKIYLYSSDDTTKWLAANDDWDDDFSGVYSALKYPFDPAKSYFLKVADLNDNTRAYSVVLQSVYPILKSTGSVTIANDDSFEDDDTPETARNLYLNAVQDRVYTTGDADWMKLVFTTP